MRFVAVLLSLCTLAIILGLINKYISHHLLFALFSCLLLFVFYFTACKLYVFKNIDKSPLVIVRQIFFFTCTLFISLLITPLLISVTPDSIIILSLFISYIIIGIVNYFLFRSIFKQTHSSRGGLPTKQQLKIVGKYLLYIAALSFPILLFSFGLLRSGEKIIPGDPDYYIQLYEAFRRSILEFHQFPFINPWIGGGIPLFANIQFGFISIQAPLVILFGSVMGMKIAIVVYQLVAFFGFKRLFEKGFKTNNLKAILLAYIPVFGSFFVDRVVAGHFTFLLIAFVPWLILFYIQRREKFSWVYFGITYSIMVWSSPHYVTIMAMLVIGFFFLYETFFQFITDVIKKSTNRSLEKIKKDVIFFAKAGGLIIILCFYRMYFVLDFIKDFPRNNPVTNETFTGIFTGLYAIWGPDQYSNPPKLTSGWGWAEAATYIGIGTLVCLIIIFLIFLYRRLLKGKSDTFSYSPVLLFALFVTFFILGMGDFGIYSPYALLSHLPIFDSMRVATRWLMWASLFALFIIAAYKHETFKRVINIILFITVVELFIGGSKVMGGAYFMEPQQYRPITAGFGQEYKYNIPRGPYSSNTDYLTNYWYDENLYETTRNNLGQVIAGDSLIDTRQPNSTIRCGENQPDCKLITDNGVITYWSPAKITIKRTAPGPIVLNINPGKGWLVNGNYVFTGYKIVDPLRLFEIRDESEIINLEYTPKLSPAWLKHTIKSTSGL